MDNREHIADCAWYLYKNMGPVIGATQKYVSGLLKRYSIYQILDDAESIQIGFGYRTADEIQAILVGELIKC